MTMRHTGVARQFPFDLSGWRIICWDDGGLKICKCDVRALLSQMTLLYETRLCVAHVCELTAQEVKRTVASNHEGIARDDVGESLAPFLPMHESLEGWVFHLLTAGNHWSILRPSLQRWNGEDTLPAPDLEAHLLFDFICTPSSPAGRRPLRRMYTRIGYTTACSSLQTRAL